MEQELQQEGNVRMIETARDLFFSRGVRSVTMDQLAQKMGASKKTVYQEVESKEDLLTRVILMDVQDHHEGMKKIQDRSPDAIAQMAQVAKFLMGKMQEVCPAMHFDLKKYYPDLWVKMQELRMNFLEGYLQENLEWGKSTGLYRKDLSPPLIARIFIRKAIASTNEDFFPMDEIKRVEFLTQFISYHMYGIVSAEGRSQWEKYKRTFFENEKNIES